MYKNLNIFFLFLILIVSIISSSDIKGEDHIDIVINEIHYNPDSSDETEEFIELYNRGFEEINLGGWSFTDGIEFTFQEGTILPPGYYLCISPDLDAFRTANKTDIIVVGPYAGKLKNSGENLELSNASDFVIDSVEYNDRDGWPLLADGKGPSLELRSPNSDNSLAGSWQASRLNGGTPGGPNSSTFYDTSRIVDVFLEMNPEDLERILEDPFSKQYVPGVFTYDGQTVDNVAIRIKGNLQINFMLVNGGHKFSFKVDFNKYDKDKTFLGYQKTNLHNIVNDPSFLRENITYNLFRDAGVVVSNASYVNLHVNGEHYGLYNHIEQVDDEFLENRFGDGSGNLFKPENFFLEYLGDEEKYYNLESISLRTNEENPDYSHLIEFMRVLNSPDKPDFQRSLETIFDVDTFLRFLAVNTFILNLDSYDPLGHNYYLYDNPETGKFHFIPWDLSESFGNFACSDWEGMINFNIYNPICDMELGMPERRPLITNILSQDTYLLRYRIYMHELMDTILNVENLIHRLEEIHNFIDEAVWTDPLKHYSYEDFKINLIENVPNLAEATAAPPFIFGLFHLIEERTPRVRQQLAEGR
jgi:spore coat protein CotH